MINRRLKSYSVYRLSDTPDGYGQTNKTKTLQGTISAYIEFYNQALVNNPKYNEVKYVGVTKSSDLTLNDFIMMNNIYYQIIEITNSPRYNRFLLRECS